jgi:hypothetical protein
MKSDKQVLVAGFCINTNHKKGLLKVKRNLKFIVQTLLLTCPQ